MKPARLLAALLLALASGCGASSFTVARKTLAPVDAAAIAGHQEWTTFAIATGDKIVADGKRLGTPVEEIRAKLAAWRATCSKVELSFAAVVQALHAAKLGIDAAEVGAAGSLPVVELLAALAHAVSGLVDALSAAGAPVPPALRSFVKLVGGLAVDAPLSTVRSLVASLTGGRA